MNKQVIKFVKNLSKKMPIHSGAWLILGLILMIQACGVEKLQYVAPLFSLETPDSTNYQSLGSAESRPKIGGKEYIVSHLEAIFGPLTDPQKNVVLSQGPVVGGSEDFYENLSVPNMSAPVNPVSVSAREALRTKLCNSIAQNDQQILTALANIYKKSGPALTNFSQRAPQGAQEHSLAYSAFFPGQNATPEILENLENLSSTMHAGTPAESTLSDGWRFLLLGLCLDPAWQLL